MRVRPLGDDDRAWLARFVRERWGAAIVVASGRIHRPDELEGFVAVDEEPVGVITLSIADDACEIVTIDSVREGAGIGSALLGAAVALARERACTRVWLITTNDNLPMLRFAQKRSFVLVAVHANALEESRRLKPEIPLVGLDGIPLRDELELELRLD